MAATASVNLGFLTVLNETNGYVGGYLVTNSWGRPLEFRLSTAVQPTRVQQILYAATLRPYICAELIGKTLVDRSSIAPQLVITDTEPVLELRHRLEVPVLWVAGKEQVLPAGVVPLLPAAAGRGPILTHPRFPDDAATVRKLLSSLEGLVDLAEPFSRIREAIAEARKIGVSGRAA